MVVVLPSTRTLTRAPRAAEARTAASATSAARAKSSRCTNPPFREGFELAAGGRSSDAGLPLRRLPSRSQWRRSGGHLPSQRRDRPGFAPGSPTERRFASVRLPSSLVAASRVLSAWLPVVAWAGLIFTLSSIPDLGTGLGGWDLLLRKLAHAAEYAVLGALLFRTLGRELPAIAIGIAYAVTDEVHQAFVPGRLGSPLDVLLDAAGVLVGVFVLGRLARRAFV